MVDVFGVPFYALLFVAPVLAAAFLSAAVTFVFHRAIHMRTAGLAAASILTTQALIGALLMLFLWFTAPETSGGESQMAEAYARLFCAAVWALSLLVTVPAAVITAIRLKKTLERPGVSR